MTNAGKSKRAWTARVLRERTEHSMPEAPAEAQRHVNGALAALGIDPAAAAEREGWWRIETEAMSGTIRIVEWESGQHMVVASTRIMRVPTESAMSARLFGILLTMNTYETGVTRFALMNDWITLTAARSIEGLDQDQVVDLLHMLLQTADRLDDPLQEAFAITMPTIQVEPTHYAAIMALMRLCSMRARQVFRRLMEGWDAYGGRILTGERRVLLAQPDERHQVLAELVTPPETDPVIRIPWDALEPQWGLGADAADAFRVAVPKPSGFSIIAGLAQLAVHSGFTDALADELLAALIGLDRALGIASEPSVAKQNASRGDTA